MSSWTINEVSTNAGGLVVWPVKILIPVGFFLLVLQGISADRSSSSPSLEGRALIGTKNTLLPRQRKRLRKRSSGNGGEGMTAFLIANMAPLMFAA